MHPVISRSVDVQQIVATVDQIAALPDITTRIIQAADDPRADAFQMLKIVARDPALAARILTVVNSSYYGISKEITSLERAIALLGLKTVRDLAVASSLRAIYQGGALCEGFVTLDLWTHSIAVAVCARELARLMRLPIVNEVYLIGLLHDIGLLVEHQKYPNELREICNETRATNGDFCTLETKMLGFDHQQLGGALAKRWNFPASIRQAIASHHRPHEAGEHRALAGMLYVADVICCQSHEGFDLTAMHQPIEEVAETVPLTLEAIRNTRDGLKELTRLASPFLE